MAGVVKNMIVRVGADLSGLIGGFTKAGAATGNFAKQASDALKSATLSHASLAKAMAQGDKNTYIVSLTDQIRELEQEQKALKAAGFSWGFEGFEQNEVLLRSLKSELNDYIKSIQKADDETEDLGDSTKDTFSTVKTKATGATNGVEGLLKSIKRLGVVSLSLRFVRSIFGELGSIVRQYISENEALQAQVNALKSSFGQALAPAINVVTNALAKMMPYIQAVSNAISSLITNLFGSGWTTVAAGATAATKAIGGAGGAADKLKRSLQGFDEISKLNDSSNSGGGGSSLVSAAESVLPEWSAMFSEAILKGDWEYVGTTLSGKLSEVIENLDLTVLLEKLPTLQEALTEFFKGWFAGISWESIGEFLKQNITGFFENLDLGTIFKTAIKSSFGPNPIAHAAIDAMFGNSKEYFAPYIESVKGEFETVGEEIFVGVLMGIADAAISAYNWLEEYVFDPLVKAFKKIFDIHSPAAHPEIRALGKNIMLGIFEGILEIAKSPLEWIKTNVFNPIQQAMQSLFDGNVMAKFTVSVRNTSSTWWSNVKTWWSQKATQPVQAFTTSVKNESSVWWNNVKAWWEAAKGTLLMNAFVRDESKTWWENVKAWWDKNKATLLMNAFVRDESKTWWENVKKWWNANVGTLSVSVAIINNSKKWWEDVKKWWNENVSTLLVPLGFGTLNSRGSSQQLNSGARSSEASLSLGDGSALAGRIAAQMFSSAPADNQNITVNLVLDGKIVTSTVVRNINSQARATGHNPLSAYL